MEMKEQESASLHSALLRGCVSAAHETVDLLLLGIVDLILQQYSVSSCLTWSSFFMSRYAGKGISFQVVMDRPGPE